MYHKRMTRDSSERRFVGAGRVQGGFFGPGGLG